MVVPLTGAVILIVGTFLFFRRPDLLYAAMIISIPFSATAVVNLSWGGNDKGVAAWLFLGALWVLRESISGRAPWRKVGWTSSRRARLALLAFVGAVIGSLCVPLIVNGTAWVPDPMLISNETIPLQFGMYNLTQTAYLAFGVLLAIFVAAETYYTTRIFYTLKLYVGSCVFVAAWGLFELWCDVTGSTYPAYVFNTNAGESALGYMEVVKVAQGSLGRISSVALEPSVLAQELLLAFVILLVCIGIQKPVLGRALDRASIALLAVTLVVSTSSTAYTGIILAVFVATIAVSRAGKPWKRYLVFAGVGISGAVVVAATVPFVGDIVAMLILGKFEAGSGLERLNSIALAAKDFLNYPLMGTGWHTVNCADLLFLILANTGLIGLIAFGSFLIPTLRDLWMLAGKRKFTAVVLLPTVALTLMLAEAAGLTYAAGYVWLVFGLGVGAVIAARGEPAGSREKMVGSPLPRAHTNLAQGNC